MTQAPTGSLSSFCIGGHKGGTGLLQIGDYGLVGDCHSAALVSMRGSVDWLCFPRFDSPSVFARLLDLNSGGYFEATPLDKFESVQRYLEDTAILENTFSSEGGSIQILSFMPTYERRESGSVKRTYGIDESIVTYHRFVTMIVGLDGSVSVRTVFAPSFRYSRLKPSMRFEPPEGFIARGDNESLTLVHLEEGEKRSEESWKRTAIGAEHRFNVNAGERHDIVLTYHSQGTEKPEVLTRNAVDHELERTKLFWKKWTTLCKYDGQYRSQVIRSLITLKLLTYAPTGAIVAAPTTSLPEVLGGERNWDYRFTWLRDAAFTAMAFMRCGYDEEAEGLMYWLSERAKAQKRGLRVLADVDGNHEIVEEELEWLAGYKDSRPVRIGNAAVEQNQLDVFGEVLDAFYHLVKDHGTTPSTLREIMIELVDHVSEHWSDAGQGIWEMRTEPKNHVYSKAMCWRALDRGIALARIFGLEESLGKWENARDDLKRSILERGFNTEIGSFVQSYESQDLDASLLLLPRIGLIDARDNKIESTMMAVKEALSRGDFLYRYKTHDGLTGIEGCFLAASFWLVDALVKVGRLEEARERFERMLTYANHLGLYAEEIDPSSHEFLGNYPQALTHIGLVNSALNLTAGS